MKQMSMFVKKKKLKRAFTLVELLVVIAIIAGLVGLLLPNLRKLQEHALLTKCQNNLREISKAVGQYLQDFEGYFIYPGPGGSGAEARFHEYFSGDPSRYGKEELGIGKIAAQSAGGGTYSYAGADGWGCYGIIARYVPYQEISMSNLSAGIAPIRACPVVLQDIKRHGNFFNPNHPNFKGWRTVITFGGEEFEVFDFQKPWVFLQGTDGVIYYELYAQIFTTYGINPLIMWRHQKDINPNAVAFIDWNAKDGWGAYLAHTTWMFTSTNRPVNHKQGDPKWTNAWWLTEVGFYHPAEDGTRGAAYLTFDGRIGVISSNKISYDFMLGK